MPATASLHRSATDVKLAGVCGGVAERWDVDPVLVRVGAVLLALTGGVGLVLYLAGWLLLPVAGSDRAAVDDLFGGAAARWPRELWITLVVVACILSFALFGAVSPFGVVPALAVAALWWFGFHRPRARRRREAASSPAGTSYAVGPTVPGWEGPATPFTHAAAAWQARVAEVRSGVWATPPAPPAPPAPAPVWTPVPPPRAEATNPYTAQPLPTAAVADPDEAARAAFLAEPDPVGLYVDPVPAPLVRPGSTLAARRLRLATLTALGLTWLGLGTADALGASVGLAVYAGAGLLVLALGLVAATRWGRPRGLLPAAALLAVGAVVVSGLVGPTLAGPAREATRFAAQPVAYTSAAAFPAGGDSLDTGDLDVDLTGLTLTADATYRADVDTGRLVVRTPPGTGVVLHYDVDTGDVQAYGSHLAFGSDLSGDPVLVAPAAGQRTLTLDLSMDTGAIEVRS